MRLCGFGQIAKFPRQHAGDFIAQLRREPDSAFRNEKIHIQDRSPLLRDLGSRAASSAIATGVGWAMEHGTERLRTFAESSASEGCWWSYAVALRVTADEPTILTGNENGGSTTALVC
jgi:hypothetical protein